MFNYIIGHYAYWLVFILLMIGLYAMMMKRNLVKKLIGMNIFQVALILFYVACASKWGGTVPVLTAEDLAAQDGLIINAVNTAKYINPLPHCLMLSAIVVGVATTGVAFALVITIYKRYKTLDEAVLLERMKKEKDDNDQC